MAQVIKESACNAGDPGSIPGSGRSPGGGHEQYSCLENSMDRGAWQATVLGVTQSELNMTELTAGTQSRDIDRAASMTSIQQSGRLCAESGICLAKS